MPVPVFGGNPRTWASFNLQKENKQFDTQMLEFLRQLSAWASLVQTLTIQMLNGGLPAGPQGPTGPPGAQGPIGPAGPQGVNANTTSTSTFTVPAVGQTVSVTVADASWIVVGQMLYVDTAGGGPGLAGFLQVTAKSANTLTLLNPQPAPAIPLADNTQSGLLRQLSGNTTDFVDGTNHCQNLIGALATLLIPTGTVLDFSGSTAPTGFLLCDGTSYPTATYPNLFNVIGYTYGGSGANFNVPDNRGRASIGAGLGSGLTNRLLAATGGEETHALSIAELASHTHVQNAHSHSIGAVQGTSSGGGYAVGVAGSGGTAWTVPAATAVNQNTGSGTAHNTMMPFIAYNRIIKT